MEMVCSRRDPSRDTTCGGQWVIGGGAFFARDIQADGRGARRSIRDGGTLRFRRSGLKGDALEPGLEFVQGKLTLQSVAFFAVGNLSV